MKVVHVSVDGLTPRVVEELGRDKLKFIYYLQDSGVWTHNARTDKNYTITLPNHFCMFTGRGSMNFIKDGVQFKGHKVSFNSNISRDIHALKEEYVHSVFDSLKAAGLKTGMFVGKSKFAFVDKSYDDNTGKLLKADGIDEIDMYYMDEEYKLDKTIYKYGRVINEKRPIRIIENFISSYNNNMFDYYFIHFRGTDSMGHEHGWSSEQYKQAVIGVDNDLGKILKCLKDSKEETFLILTSDHGGGGGGGINIDKYHHDATKKVNFTIPFYIWRNTKDFKSKDLYSINPQRLNPDPNFNPEYMFGKQPIRNGDVANYITKLFKLKSVEGSWIGYDQDLRAE